MSNNYRLKLWSYPLFQIPLILFGLCVFMAVLFWLLGFGRPQVAVSIALDLSTSTYGNIESFNAPGSVMNQEVQAVQAYLQQNNPEILRSPNLVKVFGFGSSIKPLTGSFEANSKKVEESLSKSLEELKADKETLVKEIVPGGTDISLAIQTSINALKTVQKKCRELILVTDGQGDVSPVVISDAVLNQVKINSVVIGVEAPALRGASFATGGQYLSGSISSLESFFTNDFFQTFNSNLKWIIFWLGMAWICLMWALVLPLDRWLFQGLMGKRMDTAGKWAISHALFWTVTTISLLWRFWGIPFLSGC